METKASLLALYMSNACARCVTQLFLLDLQQIVRIHHGLLCPGSHPNQRHLGLHSSPLIFFHSHLPFTSSPESVLYPSTWFYPSPPPAVLLPSSDPQSFILNASLANTASHQPSSACLACTRKQHRSEAHGNRDNGGRCWAVTWSFLTLFASCSALSTNSPGSE